MKKYFYWFFLPLVLFIGCSDPEIKEPAPKPGPKTLAEQLAEADWETTAVTNGVVWKYHHFNDLFSANQSVTILDVDLSKETITTDIEYVTSGFLKTSEAAKSRRAFAAINGSYFDTSKGGSTVFFRKNGEIINQTRSGFTPYRENAGFAIDAEGGIAIVEKPGAGWASVDAHTLLVGGPLLVSVDELVKQQDVAFNTDRHPRTAVGVTKDNRLIAVVVDGRTNESHGMTIEEIASVMKALGCVNAMNLDGGGSSTAYVMNRGVVNYPCDNQKFDHEGERGVATVIVFAGE